MPSSPASDSEPPPGNPSTARERSLGLATLLLALAPGLISIWTWPWFVTQDGPAHVYNAHILLESLGPSSPFRDVYQAQWDPLPNWTGHLSLMGLLAVLPPRQADRMMMSLTLAGFAASIVWLRWRVAGWRDMPASALLASLLAMNLTWVFGFYSFLLGACLFPITLGVWWGGRNRFGPGRSAALMALLVLGYFSHPISLGLTVGGLGLLALLTPGPRWRSRLGWTALGLLPLLPLGWLYRRRMHAGGAFEPIYENLKNPWSLNSWREQLGWVDPLTIGSKTALPFLAIKSPLFGLLTPIVWMSLGLLALTGASLIGPSGHDAGSRQANDEASPWRERRGWAVLAIVLLIGGVASPDTLGRTHGFYLSQRIFLLGLVAVVPLIGVSRSRPNPGLSRVGTVALGVATLMQAGFVCDYARRSDRLAGGFMKAWPHVGRGQRLGTLLLDLRGPYRANPLLHIDSMLGVGTGNIVWANYESAQYYFPVQIRPEVVHPPVLDFEAISITDDPKDAPARARAWERLLSTYHKTIDRIVVWGRDPTLDAITGRWYEPTFDDREGHVRVWSHRPEVAAPKRDREPGRASNRDTEKLRVSKIDVVEKHPGNDTRL